MYKTFIYFQSIQHERMHRVVAHRKLQDNVSSKKKIAAETTLPPRSYSQDMTHTEENAPVLVLSETDFPTSHSTPASMRGDANRIKSSIKKAKTEMRRGIFSTYEIY